MTAESIEQMKARLKREDEEKEEAFQKRLEEIMESQAPWRAEQEEKERAEEHKRKKLLDDARRKREQEMKDSARSSWLDAGGRAEDFYEFEPYNYGPFCSEVYRDAEALAEEGLVQISLSGEGYSLYSATQNGIAERDRLCGLLTEDIAGYARQLIEWVRAQSFRGLVSEIYRRYPQYRVNSVFAD